MRVNLPDQPFTSLKVTGMPEEVVCIGFHLHIPDDTLSDTFNMQPSGTLNMTQLSAPTLYFSRELTAEEEADVRLEFA